MKKKVTAMDMGQVKMIPPAEDIGYAKKRKLDLTVKRTKMLNIRTKVR